MNMETVTEGLRPPEIQGLVAELAPYPFAINNYAKEKIRGHDNTIDRIFKEESRQAIETFNPSVESQQFPGVKISTIELEFTRDFARSFNKNQALQLESQLSEDKDGQKRKSKTYIYFLQPAFGAGFVGNAFSILDAASDRLIRDLPKVLEGDRVVVVLQGSPLSIPGAVTKEWVNGVRKEGFDMHGKLYAEHAKKYLYDNFGDDLENVVVTVQGQSRGSNTAARTVYFLNEDEDLKAVRTTQAIKKDKDNPKPKPVARGLYDAPTGNHDRNLAAQLKHSVNMASGLAGETVARMMITKDQVLGDLGKTEALFMQRLFKSKEIKPDDSKQKLLKNAALLAEALALGRGTPIDETERGFYREPGFDPTNVQRDLLKNFRTDSVGIRLESRKPFLRSKGRNLIARTTIAGHYFFPWQNDLHRWEQVLQMVEGGKNSIVRRPMPLKS
jgi:hypothetical protein